MAKRIASTSTARHAGAFAAFSTSLSQRADAETQALLCELEDRRARSPNVDPAAVDRLAAQVLAPVLRQRPLPDAIRLALERCARELIATEVPVFELPETAAADALAGVEVRARLRARIAMFDNEHRLVADLIARLSRCLTAIVAALPTIAPKPATFHVPVPLLDLAEAPATLLSLLIAELIPLTPDPRAPVARPGARLATRLTDNLVAASGLSMEDALKRPHRLKWPHSDKAPPRDLVDIYLADTPLAAVLQETVMLPVSDAIRYESAQIVAPTGWGKTQLAQQWLLRDIDDPARPGLVWIDSQQDSIRVLTRLSRFDPDRDDRCLILDPGDTNWPLQLNMLGFDRARISRLPLGLREQLHEGNIQLVAFIFRRLLGAEMTGKQALVFRMLAQWIVNIPDATIRTLLELMADPTPFLPYLDGLGETAQTFLRSELFSTHYRETRQELQRRLYHLLASPLFERLVTSRTNGIDFKTALDAGKIIFVNTARDQLKDELSSFFGAIMIAQIMRAVLERAADPEPTRRPWWISIDEAGEYLGHSDLGPFLLASRKYHCGWRLFHQNLEGQISNAALKAALKTTAIHIAGALSASDAAALAPDMRTSSEFLMRLRKRETATEFACHVRGVTPTAVKLSVPFGVVEREPRMSDAAYARLLARVRAQVASPLTPTSKKPPAMPPPPSTDDDDFSENY